MLGTPQIRVMHLASVRKLRCTPHIATGCCLLLLAMGVLYYNWRLDMDETSTELNQSARNRNKSSVGSQASMTREGNLSFALSEAGSGVSKTANPQEALFTLAMANFASVPSPEWYSRVYRNHVCYAARHNFSVILNLVDTKHAKEHPHGHITYQKPQVVHDISQRMSTNSFLWWLDMDIAISNPSWAPGQWLNDHVELATVDSYGHALNNGAFIVRNSARGRAWVKKWLAETYSGFDWIGTDNGSFDETLLSEFLQSTYQNQSCGRRMGRDHNDAKKWEPCVRNALNTALGENDNRFQAWVQRWATIHNGVPHVVSGQQPEVTSKPRGRLKEGLWLIPPEFGFNSYAHGYNPSDGTDLPARTKMRPGALSAPFVEGWSATAHTKFPKRFAPDSSLTCAPATKSMEHTQDLTAPGWYAAGSWGACILPWGGTPPQPGSVDLTETDECTRLALAPGIRLGGALGPRRLSGWD